jgi:8-oxo-dGTP pyrophosphatase MutT (NUDIX family)
VTRRADLVALLEAHEPADADERSDLASMRRLARTLAQPFSAEEPEAHFTASALVVDPDLARVCLVHHRKLDRWLQPGGHIEPDDESVLAAAEREVVEETALSVHPLQDGLLDVDVHEYPERDGRQAHLHLDCRFLLVADDADSLRSSAESTDVQWFTLDEASGRADAGLRRMIEKLTRE